VFNRFHSVSSANISTDPSTSSRPGHGSDPRSLLYVLQGGHRHADHHYSHTYLPASDLRLGKSSECRSCLPTNILMNSQTFFSTDIVKYQDRDRGGSFSKEAMYRWLQVTLPLSALTLSVGYGWYRYKTTKSKRTKLLPS